MRRQTRRNTKTKTKASVRPGGRCRRQLQVLLLLALILSMTTAFAFAGNEKDELHFLIAQRTEAMNGYFSSQLGYQQAKAMLQEVEADQLLARDLADLHAYFRTDIELIEQVEIEEIEITESDAQLLCARVRMNWQVAGMDGETETISHTYSAIARRSEGSLKLVHFF